MADRRTPPIVPRGLGDNSDHVDDMATPFGQGPALRVEYEVAGLVSAKAVHDVCVSRVQYGDRPVTAFNLNWDASAHRPLRRSSPRSMTALGVRRGKAALFHWVQVPPGHRSSRKQPEQSWR